MTRYLVQVEAVADLSGCLTVLADSPQDAMRRAEALSPDVVTWKRPDVRGQVVAIRSLPMEGDVDSMHYVEREKK